MTPENRMHPVITAAYEYADKITLEPDRATRDKTLAVNRDRFLLTAASGAYQLIKEMKLQNNVKHPYELLETYRLLLTIKERYTSLAGSFAFQLTSAGVADSEDEVDLIIAQARYEIGQQQSIEHPPKVVPMIGVVGQISSGKGTVGEILQSKFGGEHLPLSDQLRRLSLFRGGDMSFPRHILREINDDIKPVYGNDVFVKWTIDMAQRRANRYDYPVVSIDGFRSLEEAQTFQSNNGILIAIHANQQIRFDRLVARGRLGDDGWLSFLESDKREGGWITPIFDICDYSIDNNGDEDSLNAQIEEIIGRMNILV